MEDLYSDLNNSRRGNSFICSFLVEQDMIAAVKYWLNSCEAQHLAAEFEAVLQAEGTRLNRKGALHHALHLTPRLLVKLLLFARRDDINLAHETEVGIGIGQIRARIETWALAWMSLRDVYL